MVFGFVVLQSDITCAPQHTKWRPLKNWLYLSTRCIVWPVFAAPSVCCFTVGHYARSSAQKMATPQELTVFEHTVYCLAGVRSSIVLLFYSRTLRALLSTQNGDTSRTDCIWAHGVLFGRCSQLHSLAVLQSDITCAPQHTKWRPVKF